MLLITFLSPSWNICKSELSPNTALEESRNFKVFVEGVNVIDVTPAVEPIKFTISPKVEIPVILIVSVSIIVVLNCWVVVTPVSVILSNAPSNLVAVTTPVNSPPPFT